MTEIIFFYCRDHMCTFKFTVIIARNMRYRWKRHPFMKYEERYLKKRNL